MDWSEWNNKKVFIRTIMNKVYSGYVSEIADLGNGIIFISIVDKFGLNVTLRVDSIEEIKEEINK